MDEIRLPLLKLLGSEADRRSLDEAEALNRERDPELYFENLLVFAGRQQSRGNFAVAASIYESLGACPLPAISERARQHLSALIGQGSVGGRAEFLVSQFSRQATDYRTIVPMIAGTTIFNLTRAATLGRLAGSGAWFSRGLAARVTANLTGFAFEVPTFSLLSRGLMDLSGEPVSWSGGAVAKDLAGTAVTLGALKSFAYVGNQAALKIGAGRFNQAAISQASAFSGMLLAHHAETALGLRPKSDGATAVTDTLAALVSLGIGGHLGRRALGTRFARWNAELGLRTSINSSPGFEVFSPKLAWAHGQIETQPRPLAMSTPKDRDPSEPFYISTGRVRGSSDGHAPETATAMPFRTLVHRNNLYGGRVLNLAFQKPGQVYTLGSKSSAARQYTNLDRSASGKPGVVMVANRDGYLHHRQRVEDRAEQTPDFINLFRNEGIGDRLATLEERNGQLFLRNLTRESLVWVLEGAKWQAIAHNKELLLKDSSWIVLGKNPSELPENTLDPRKHTVLRVEVHRPKPLLPDRWNLIEFETREPEQLEKIPTSEAYLAALLGQSPDFVAWRFRPLFKAIEEAGWKGPEVKELFLRVFNDSPILAELNIGLLADVLGSAHRKGWTHSQLRELLFHEALTGKNGMPLLNRLPKLLEESAALNLAPSELTGILARMAKYEKQFSRSLEVLPDLLREWQKSTGTKPRTQALIDFLDKAQVSIEVLRDLFSKIRGGEEAYLETMTRLIPEIQDRYGYRGGTMTEISAEILARMAEHVPSESSPKAWVNDALSTLPKALGKLVGLEFSYLEQRQILLRSAEQGLNFSSWWEAARSERGVFEDYMKKSGIPLTGILGLTLGLLGLHELNAEVLQAASPALLLGVTVFFKKGPPVKAMGLRFALGLRLKTAFSSGREKIQNLSQLGKVMEDAGYLREAHERYEAAVELAENELARLNPRDPGNRNKAGEAHRTLARAYFILAGFWDRRPDHRSQAMKNYKTALDHVETLGTRRTIDMALIGTIRTRLCNIHLAEAEHWERMGQGHRAAENFEAAADAAKTFTARIDLLHRAARAYARAEPARYLDFVRVMRKINH